MLTSSGFALFIWGIWIPLKWLVNFLQSPTSTAYFSNSTASSMSNHWFSPDIECGLSDDDMYLGLGFGNLWNYVNRYNEVTKMENFIPSFLALSIVRLTVHFLINNWGIQETNSSIDDFEKPSKCRKSQPRTRKISCIFFIIMWSYRNPSDALWKHQHHGCH